MAVQAWSVRLSIAAAAVLGSAANVSCGASSGGGNPGTGGAGDGGGGIAGNGAAGGSDGAAWGMIGGCPSPDCPNTGLPTGEACSVTVTCCEYQLLSEGVQGCVCTNGLWACGAQLCACP
jgi:hypothetical protein